MSTHLSHSSPSSLPAGLEDYASPIIDAIDPTRRLFTSRIYREGTLRTEHYQVRAGWNPLEFTRWN